MKKKKLNLIPILIPTLSVATISAVAIPMAVVICNDHIKFAKEADVSAWTGGNGIKVYDLMLNEPAQEGQKLEISTTLHKYAISDCNTDVIAQPVLTLGSVVTSVTLKLVRIDGEALKSGNSSRFDMHFVLKDAQGNVIWKDKIAFVKLQR